MSQRLYHYTCGHRVDGIRRSGKLEPNAQPTLGGLHLVWLTDLAEPDVYGLGLTSHILKCRRTEYRAVVDADAVHWPAFARQLRRSGTDAQRWGVEDLESATLALPMHWWVSPRPIAVVELEAVS